MLIDRRKHQLEHTGFLKSLRKRQQYGWLRLVLFFLILFNFFNVSCVENIVFKINAHCFTAGSAMSCMCSNFLDTRFTHTVHNSWSAPWLHHLTLILKYIAVIKRHWDFKSNNHYRYGHDLSMRAGRQVVDPERGEGQLVMYFLVNKIKIEEKLYRRWNLWNCR